MVAESDNAVPPINLMPIDIINRTNMGQEVKAAELLVLKILASQGSLEEKVKVSGSRLADHLDYSNQTSSRRLQRLDDAGYIEREVVNDDQWVQITPDGESVLRQEYADYRQIFEGKKSIELQGSITSGMGEGRHYITLPGYMKQFVNKLNYEPFPGTLNVNLTEDSVQAHEEIAALEPIHIEGWSDDERTYGPAYCYPARVETSDTPYEPTHVITPERTHHDEDQLEIIASVNLRDELCLKDGDKITIHVEGM